MNTIKKINTDEDIIKIRKVINTAFQTVADDFGYTKENVPKFPAFIMEDILHKQIDKGLILFGYEINNIFAGSIGIHDTGKDGIFLMERLAVLPEYRHAEIGSKLMDFAIQKIMEQNGRIAEVEIVHENAKLRNWYISKGFIEKRIDHYSHLPFSVGVLSRILEKKR